MTQNEQINDVLSQFAERLLEAKGISGLDEEIMNQMKSDLVDRLQTWLNSAIIKLLPETVLPQAESLIDAGDAQGLQELCAKEIPNLQEVMAQEMVNFKDTYLK